jgi:hypothetical protein
VAATWSARRRRRVRLALALLTVLATIAGCGEAKPQFSFKPEFLPLTITVGPDGVAVSGNASIATPIGVFSIGVQQSLLPKDPSIIYVTIRIRSTDEDHIFRVQNGNDELTAVIDGKATIQVRDGHILIDVARGAVEEIRFQHLARAPEEVSSNKWERGNDSGIYKPFALTPWAYDDSTIGKWYGIGFIWFLIRLALTIICLILDVLLTIIWFVGQIVYLVFGSVGRNVWWGLVAFAVIIGIGAWINTS